VDQSGAARPPRLSGWRPIAAEGRILKFGAPYLAAGPASHGARQDLSPRMFAARSLRPSSQGWFPTIHARNKERTPMNDEFPPPGWFMRPQTWPYWMPNSLLGARTLPALPRDIWDAPFPGTSRGGILGTFAEPDGTWARSTFTGRRPATPSNAGVGILGSLTQSADDLPPSPSTPIQEQMADDAPTPLSLPRPSRPDLLALLARAQFESGGQSIPTAGKKVDQAECDDMHRRDLFQCKMVGSPSCHAQAYLRYTNCLNGRQIPPLNY
jgi:hypothetical protein